MLAMVLEAGVGAQPIAAHAARALVERGETRARFVTEQPLSGGEFASRRFETSVLEGLAGIDGVLRGVEDLILVPALDQHVVQRQLGILDAAQRAGVKRVTLVSLIGARRESPVRLLCRFGTLQQQLKTRGFAHSILQSAPLMQALVVFAWDGRTQRLEAPFRDVRLPWLDARDLGRVVGLIASERAHTGRTYRMTGPAAINLAEVATRLSAVLGKRVAYEDICMHQAHGCLQRAGVESGRIQILTEWWDAMVSGLVDVRVSRDIRNVARSMPHTVDAFIAEHKDWFTGAAPGQSSQDVTPEVE